MTVERPLRQKVSVNKEIISKFEEILKKLGVLEGKFDKKKVKEFADLGAKNTKWSKMNCQIKIR